MEEKKDEKRVIQCFLCLKMVDLRTSRKNKPYFICSDCGIQVFFRGKEGIARLEKKIGPKTEDFKSTDKKLAQLKAELRKVDEEIKWDFFDHDLELPKKRNGLVKKIKELEDDSFS